jgi:hypothetical protein
MECEEASECVLVLACVLFLESVLLPEFVLLLERVLLLGAAHRALLALRGSEAHRTNHCRAGPSFLFLKKSCQIANNWPSFLFLKTKVSNS